MTCRRCTIASLEGRSREAAGRGVRVPDRAWPVAARRRRELARWLGSWRQSALRRQKLGTLLAIVAYTLAFVLGPLIAGLLGLVTLPLVALFRQVPPLSFLVVAASSVAQGIVAVWIGVLIFTWLNQPPNLLMVFILAVGYAMNDFRRVRFATGTRSLELARAVSALMGIVIGAFVFVV